MRDKKALRAQRHLSQPKISDRIIQESRAEKSESFEKTSNGLKKSLIYNGSKYIIDMVKE